MATTNILYRIPNHRGTRVATITGQRCTLLEFRDYVVDSEGLCRDDFILAYGTGVFRSDSCRLQSTCLQNNSHIDVVIPLRGGKGGFGSLLRAIGAQIEKTTNRDACRDLSGRRLRDVKREDELKKLLALQAKLQEERKRRKKEKLEKLKQRTEKTATSASIQELVSMFDDRAYNKRRLELADILDVAVDKGIINFKKRNHSEKSGACEDSSSDEDGKKKVCLDPKPESGDGEEQVAVDSSAETTDTTSRQGDSKCTAAVGPRIHGKTKKNDLWLGLDEDDEI